MVVALGLWILRVRPRRRVNVLLGLFVGGYGGQQVFNNLTDNSDPSQILFLTFSGAFAFLLVPALVLLALRLSGPASARDRGGIMVAALIAGAFAILDNVLLLGFYASSLRTNVPYAIAVAAGSLVIPATFFALLLFAMRFRGVPERDRPQLSLVSAALGLQPLISVGVGVLSPSAVARQYAYGMLLLSAVLCVLWLWNTAGQRRRPARNLAVLIPALVLVGLIAQVAAREDGVRPSDSGLYGMARLVTVALLAYAILRHQLLGLDVKVKWTIRRGTLAAVFLAVFFVVAQMAQNYFAQYGVLVGGAAAGLLLFGLNPLQRFAERVADTAMPTVRAPGEMTTDDRLGLYREQLRVAYADGAVDRNERALLLSARSYLGISADEAEQLEREVSGMVVPAPST